MSQPVCLVPAGDRCGEGVVWVAAERALYWTDINRFLIHRYDGDTRSVKSWFFAEPVTTLGLTDRPGTLIAALGSKVILWQPANDARADFARPEIFERIAQDESQFLDPARVRVCVVEVAETDFAPKGA